jgi:hypothetical protein
MRKSAASEIQRRRNEKMKLLRRDGTEIGEGESLREIAIAEKADLSWANLSGADLSGANLSGADLSGANLSRANLSGANLSWNSHALIGEILKRAAQNDKGLRSVAGLILVSTDWCWEKLLTELTPEQIAWCKETLRPWWEGKEEQLPEKARKIVEASK